MRVRLSGSFVLPGSLAAVLPLFTAEGERRWAPGWEPVWADEAHQHEVGEVWTTAGPPSTSWVTVDTGANHVRYARLAIGDSAGLVTVTCVENSGRTTVTVDYDLSALSDSGAEDSSSSPRATRTCSRTGSTTPPAPSPDHGSAEGSPFLRLAARVPGDGGPVMPAR
jgi:hypothetical protein